MMLLKSGGASVMAVTCWPSRRVTCFASSKPSTEQLRAQLDQLHSEADTARTKANSARMRLMRLSEAAGSLKRQAEISVRSGKEDDAREILFQKKKVMEALEKSKARIELLDELSSKLQEAISLKERQLIGNVAMDLEVVGEKSSSSIYLVSPVPDVREDIKESDKLRSYDDKLEVSQGLEYHTDRQASLQVDQIEQDDLQGYALEVGSSVDAGVNSLRQITSFGGFLEHMDKQLMRIETELATVLRVSTLLLNGEEKMYNFKVQQTMELLESIRVIRQRIANIRLVEADER